MSLRKVPRCFHVSGQVSFPTMARPNDGVSIWTYNDHRMAMVFSLVACCGVEVRICNPACTAKIFPTYFDEVKKLSVSSDRIGFRLDCAAARLSGPVCSFYEF